MAHKQKTETSTAALKAVAEAQAVPIDIDNLDISIDKLRGAAEIAAFIGEPVERVRWLIRHRQIPYGKQGALIIASRRALLEHYARATTGKSAA